MKKALNIRLDPNDSFDRNLNAMLDGLQRNHFQLWVMKVLRHRLGEGSDPSAMLQRVRDDLMGGKLEDGHKRSQRSLPDRSLERPIKSEPIGKHVPEQVNNIPDDGLFCR